MDRFIPVTPLSECHENVYINQEQLEISAPKYVLQQGDLTFILRDSTNERDPAICTVYQNYKQLRIIPLTECCVNKCIYFKDVDVLVVSELRDRAIPFVWFYP